MSTGFRAPAGEAPPAPREMSPDMMRDSAEQGRFLRLFGAIWAGVGGGVGTLFLMLAALVMPQLALGAALGGVFATVGMLLWTLGVWQRSAARAVFRDGVETSGVVVDVYRDVNVRMNGRNPWRVAYELEGPDGRPVKGTATFWDHARPEAEIGQRVVVLYDRDKPSRNVLWTRLARTFGAPRQAVAGARIADTAGARIAPLPAPATARIAEPEVEVAASEEDAAAPRGDRARS